MLNRLVGTIVSGISNGSDTALIAVSLTLLYSVLRVLNFAQGVIVMLGAFTAYLVEVHLGVDLWLGVLLAAVVGAILSVVIEFVVFRPLRRAKAGINEHRRELAGVVATLGVSIVVSSFVEVRTSGGQYTFPRAFAGISNGISIGDVTIAPALIATSVLALVAVIGLDLLLTRTRFGRLIRATASDPGLADLTGIRTGVVFVALFALSGALAGIGGVIAGLTSAQIDYSMGDIYLINAFAAMIVGGIGNIRSTFWGAMALGLVGSILTLWFSGAAIELGTFALMFVVIAIRPSGLFYRKIGAVRYGGI